jgi:hypothetical protein
MAAMVSPEERKAKTEAMLKTLGIPVNPYLPLVEAEDEVRIRHATEVASRCGVLVARAAIGFKVDRDVVWDWLNAEGLLETASAAERRFFEKAVPSEEEKREATWDVEKLYPLLWAIGYIDSLGLPRQECDTTLIQQIVPPIERAERSNSHRWRDFIQNATLRTTTEILDALDMIYRIDWAVVECRIHNQAPPAGLNPDVVYEWHYAIEWLTCYAEDWDDITCDT